MAGSSPSQDTLVIGEHTLGCYDLATPLTHIWLHRKGFFQE